MTGGRTTAGKLTSGDSGVLFVPGRVTAVAAKVDTEVAVAVRDFWSKTETGFHLFL